MARFRSFEDLNIKFDEPLTPKTLYKFAKAYGMENNRIRISDGMAVSYFPTNDALCLAKDKIVVDVSAEPCYDYDDLAANDKVILYSIKGIFAPARNVEDEDLDI